MAALFSDGVLGYTVDKEMTERAKGEEIIAYKGFNKDWTCRGYQYEVGKTHKYEGDVVACHSGFHACENPLDVLNYYDLHDGSRFALVTVSGEITRDHNEDTKIAARILKVARELSMLELLRYGLDWVKTKVLCSARKKTDRYGSDVTFGRKATATISGNKTIAATIGPKSTAATDGDLSIAAAAGCQSTAVITGDMSTAVTTGYRSAVVSSGAWSTVATSGDRSTAATFGYKATAATSGEMSTSVTSGDLSTAATSGYSSIAITSGEMSTAATSGGMSTAVVTGKNSVALAVGKGARAKASAGGAIVCCHFNERGDLIHIRASKVGKNGIKPNVYYMLDKDGEFLEVAA